MSRPKPSSDAVRRRFENQGRRDTRPELALRRRLHSRGYRYRVDHPPLQGLRRRADLVFTRKKVAVFVDGCFWHRCPEHYVPPKANAGWWEAKIATNVDRDQDTDARLTAAGWVVLRCWEHESVSSAARRVERALADAGPA